VAKLYLFLCGSNVTRVLSAMLFGFLGNHRPGFPAQHREMRAPSDASAKRSTSIWRTGGSAGSGSTAMSRIIPPSRRTGMAGPAER
jgi:hypothetical protein